VRVGSFIDWYGPGGVVGEEGHCPSRPPTRSWIDARPHLCEHLFVGSEIASLGADFQRAVQQGNVIRAEAAARRLGQLTLENALRLLFVYAEKEPEKFERAALRRLARYVTEGKKCRC
jgi:hypothetical protein